MAAARPSAPIRVLDGDVDLEPLTGEPGQGWSRIACASKKAYGCGKSIEEAVQGLTLYVRLGNGPLVTSSLAFRMSDEALRRFYSEPDEPGSHRKKRRRKKKYAVGRILKVEQDLMVIGICFRGGDCPDDLFYFLLYDSIDASLSVISYLPELYKATAALQTVPNRTLGGACELLLTGREMTSGQPPVLCVFSPAANSACPWQINRMRFPPGLIHEPFMATKAFSFQGKGFWVDLTQGLVCCDLQYTTSSDCNSAVDFGFIALPAGCELDVAGTLKLRDDPPNLTRIVGCSGNTSIWFICVDCANDYEDDSVTMWTLQSPQGRWKEEWKFSTTELWGFDGFKEAGLPEAPPEFPALTADGHLCLVLTDQRRPYEGDVVVGHICGIDVPKKRVLWHRKVHNYPFTQPVIFPSSFFRRTVSCHGHSFFQLLPELSGGAQRELAEKRKAGEELIRPRHRYQPQGAPEDGDRLEGARLAEE